MAICETCKKRYTPTSKSPDCPYCARAARPAQPAAAHAAAPAARPAASAARPARTAARPKAAARPAAATEPEDEIAQHTPEDYGKPTGMLDQSSKIGLIAAGGLALVTLIVGVVVMNTHAEEKERLELYQKEVRDLHEQLAAIDLNDEAAANRLLKLAKDKENRWKNHELAAKIQSLMARASASLQTGQERRETLGRFTEIEKQLADTSAMTPEALNDVRRRLTELESKISLAGDEFVKRYAEAGPKADMAYVTKLLESAQAMASTPRPALTKCQAAEDEIKKLLDAAYLAKNQTLQDFYADLYRKAIEQSDQFAVALFTDKNMEDLPWKDCLSGEQKGFWNDSKTKGFSARVMDDGALLIVGPDADAGKIAIVSIGDREQWRNFVLEMEFTVEKGNFDLFLRLGRSPNANTVSYPFISEGDQANLQAKRTYKTTMRLLGSQFLVRFSTDDLDTPPPKDEKVSWAKSRKGAVGFLVPAGARIRVTSFKVRELR